MEQQCESLAYEIELKNEKISKLQTSLNEKTLQLEKEQGKFLKKFTVTLTLQTIAHSLYRLKDRFFGR